MEEIVALDVIERRSTRCTMKVTSASFYDFHFLPMFVW
jgi:hypothetical protein